MRICLWIITWDILSASTVSYFKKKLTGVVVVGDYEFYCSAQLKSCDFQM